ncbi:hypothetical protein HOY82DRAFT_478013, partial [Tuber indicum]
FVIIFIYFFTLNLFQMSLFIVLLEGVLSYNPPVRESAFQPFDRFLIQPPPLLQRCLGMARAAISCPATSPIRNFWGDGNGLVFRGKVQYGFL